jgi:hypothetical protein
MTGSGGIIPQSLCFVEIDAVFGFVRFAFLSIEFERHAHCIAQSGRRNSPLSPTSVIDGWFAQVG